MPTNQVLIYGSLRLMSPGKRLARNDEVNSKLTVFSVATGEVMTWAYIRAKQTDVAGYK